MVGPGQESEGRELTQLPRTRFYCSGWTAVIPECHWPTVCSGAVLVRYRYLLYPSPRQQRNLARVFGCARVVFNDSLRLRALVQACNDARRAYRNWFDSLAGRRKGRRVGHPRLRRKHGRQSIRLTRNGFSLRGERLYVAKVGEIRVRWSRLLPSEPSSVTVIRDTDGRYYASFVVERQPVPLPVCERETGIDLGLDRLPGQVLAVPAEAGTHRGAA